MAIENKEVNLSIKINDKDMFVFMAGHVYGKLSGKLSLAFSLVCLGLLPFSFGWDDLLMTMVLLFGAMIYLVITPIMLLLQSKKQIATIPVFQDAISYKMDADGFSVLQAGEWIEFKWENLYKVTETKAQLLFYIAKDQSFIIPKGLIENKDDIIYIRKVVSDKMKSSRIKLKKEKTDNSKEV